MIISPQLFPTFNNGANYIGYKGGFFQKERFGFFKSPNLKTKFKFLPILTNLFKFQAQDSDFGIICFGNLEI